MWANTGSQRPSFAITPRANQESVWDYPRPPVIHEDLRLVEVFAGETRLARTEHAFRVCETASPPTFYLPADDVAMSQLRAVAGQSHCEWKGLAKYYALNDSPHDTAIAWGYPEPEPAFERLRGTLGFFPGRLHCLVNGQTVSPQPGQFYAGWITDDVVGPFKGEPGTGHW